MDELRLEIGPRHDSDKARCIVRLSLNGERRGKLSMTEVEALELVKVLRNGCRDSAIKLTAIITPSRR